MDISTAKLRPYNNASPSYMNRKTRSEERSFEGLCNVRTCLEEVDERSAGVRGWVQVITSRNIIIKPFGLITFFSCQQFFVGSTFN